MKLFEHWNNTGLPTQHMFAGDCVFIENRREATNYRIKGRLKKKRNWGRCGLHRSATYPNFH